MLLQVADVTESLEGEFKNVKYGDVKMTGLIVGVFDVDVYR